MENIDAVRRVIERSFQHVQEIGDGVIRAERCHDGKPYAVAYVDVSDSIVERADRLKEFQEGLLGPSFFAPDSALRWNSYVYFVAGPKSQANKDFGRAKSRIEADRQFARKFVLSERDLSRQLGQQDEKAAGDPTKADDITAVWASVLRAASLSVLLAQRPRTTILESIASGAAFKAETSLLPPKISIESDPLDRGLLRTLSIGGFRKVLDSRTFGFGDVNLIVGGNGTGKTTLLEAIEILYCGHVRRDPAAKFSNISAEIEGLDGVRVPVVATQMVQTLKSRNVSWFGRADLHSSAITEGFTRFNFLDSDAAFRLSSDSRNEDIEADVSRLLVGSETSKLWEYLRKLEGEVAARRRTLNDQVPIGRRQVELLTGVVKQLKDAPTEARTLVEEYRSALKSIQPEWFIEEKDSPLKESERVRLARIGTLVADVLSAIPETPVTAQTVRQRVDSLRTTLGSMKTIDLAHDDVQGRIGKLLESHKTSSEARALLERWIRFVEAGAPATIRRLETAQAKQKALIAELREQPTEPPLDVPVEYAQLPIDESILLASKECEVAQTQLASAQRALSQGIQLGQTLEGLRRDIHDATIAYLEKSGESALCPVCGTPHEPNELLQKVERLFSSEGALRADGLRQNVHIAQSRVERARAGLDALTAINAFGQSSGASSAISADLLRDLRKRTQDLREVTEHIEGLKSSVEKLKGLGLEPSEMVQSREKAHLFLNTSNDVDDSEALRKRLDGVAAQVDAEALAIAAAQREAGELQSSVHTLLSATTVKVTQSATAGEARVMVERAVAGATEACAKLDEIEKTISLNAETTLESAQRLIESCLLQYDRAQDAVQREAAAESELKKKEEELGKATRTLIDAVAAQDNFGRAGQALSNIVEQHPLNRATSEAFDGIKSKVSEIFAQIHSPPEYELGNFVRGKLLIGREDKQPRDANQVSTGQRAALALSIFLALNQSAETVPPVLLIDDPVAHIDDLNALSFLDYLRELVVHTRRQIFFATADVRLAALFQRKFEFLGPARFVRTSMP